MHRPLLYHMNTECDVNHSTGYFFKMDPKRVTYKPETFTQKRTHSAYFN